MRVGIPPVLLAVIFVFTLSAPLTAQTPVEETSPGPVEGRLVPPPVSPTPFSTDASTRHSAFSVEFRPADRMTEADRLLAADAESSIAEHAGLNGFEFEQGRWSYQQVVCPALPHHLFLQYTRNNGVGDVTVFSASIPRGGEGRVRIIPILRRSYSLFRPRPSMRSQFRRLTIFAPKSLPATHRTGWEQVSAMPPWLERIRRSFQPTRSPRATNRHRRSRRSWRFHTVAERSSGLPMRRRPHGPWNGQ